jgi:transcriptional regulator with XRE-family HTH domain
MLSTTLDKGLRRLGIGDKVRSLRLRRRMGLVELGRHTGLSAAMLSKIERGRLFPTLPTLLRIALVFSVELDHFFTDEKRRKTIAVVRRADRKRFPERMGTREVAFDFESLDFPATDRKMNSYLARFQPLDPKKARDHQHAGVEFLYVLRGTLSLKIGGDEHVLGTGDSIYFDSTLPHAYRRSGPRPCEALVVTAT